MRLTKEEGLARKERLDRNRAVEQAMVLGRQSYVREYFANHRVLIQYVRDSFGLRKGVVIAIAPGVVGWSEIHPDDYIPWQYNLKDLCNLPSISKILASEEAVRANLSRCFDKPGYVRIYLPSFDRKVGFEKALARATTLTTPFTEEESVDFERLGVPHDQDLRATIKAMIPRSYNYFHKS